MEVLPDEAFDPSCCGCRDGDHRLAHGLVRADRPGASAVPGAHPRGGPDRQSPRSGDCRGLRHRGSVIATLALSALLLGHAAIHVAFLAPRPPVTAGGPPWPFDMDHSRVLDLLRVPPEVGRHLGGALVVLSIGAFSFGALVSLGATPAVVWAGSVTTGAVSSLGVLALYFRRWLVIGAAI